MDAKNKLIKTAINSLIAVSTTAFLSVWNLAIAHTPDESQGEKCYGIVKKGKNDCQTATEACAGSSTADNQPDAFIFLPKGVCEKIVGSSLTMGKPTNVKK